MAHFIIKNFVDYGYGIGSSIEWDPKYPYVPFTVSEEGKSRFHFSCSYCRKNKCLGHSVIDISDEWYAYMHPDSKTPRPKNDRYYRCMDCKMDFDPDRVHDYTALSYDQGHCCQKTDDDTGNLFD